ncbi:hypothetical protein MBLNU459_g0301t1 [Dothideomycetes sp. NU459]
MKVEVTIALAIAAAGAAAQSSASFSTLTASNSSVMPVVVTMTIDDCESSSMPTMITVTNGVTITYCPECEMAASESATATPTIPHTTIYTTTYMALCTTGASWYTTPQEYTVTESCTEATPTWSSGTGYVPQGFTTTEMMCHKCAETPVPMTITMPCGCDETQGAGSPPSAAASTTAPAASGSSESGGSAAPLNSGAPGNSGASSGANGDSATPSASAGDSAAPSGSTTPASSATAPAPTPAAASTSAECPGPGCRASQPSASQVVSSPGSIASSSPSQSLEAFTGVAAHININGWPIASGALAAAIFVIAVLL